MATVESLNKLLDNLEEDHGYFAIEEILSALSLPVPDESLFETLQREHPGKTFHPDLLSSLLEKPSENRSE